MKVYVNCITSGAELRSDIKVLIPEMNLRRRMSRDVGRGRRHLIAAVIRRPGADRRDNHRDGTGMHR